ncbi:hypothetical protein RG963_09845 [Methanosarcina sp. Z-7115]|uniref:Mobile element protein n=1 Tax=Methanosarcina baikalica TaxID=3073890 RepID=A0ABU2D259_9EURY|nr:hypothetical protein [Methanosarcina sp. Z-7115]MDR7666070.1 hypothetical protein [Methanosarcina sp. Z-7115]
MEYKNTINTNVLRPKGKYALEIALSIIRSSKEEKLIRLEHKYDKKSRMI